MKRRMLVSMAAGSLTTLGWILTPPAARAQSGSLYGDPGVRPTLMLPDASWYYVELEPPREIRRYDLVTVIVNQSSQFMSEGDVQRTQRGRYDAALTDWIKMSGLSVKPDKQLDGDQKIKATLQSQLQSNMDLTSRESLKFRITAHVVDIRPNGTVILEAKQTVHNNNEVWEANLRGECRKEDILPDNTVLSQNLADLHIHKREKGHVRDAYKRGWLLRFIDYIRPF